MMFRVSDDGGGGGKEECVQCSTVRYITCDGACAFFAGIVCAHHHHRRYYGTVKV